MDLHDPIVITFLVDKVYTKAAFRSRRCHCDWNRHSVWWYVWSAKNFGDDLNSPVDKTKEIDNWWKGAWGLYFEMKRRGIHVKSLSKLLTHKDDGVRALAARHLYWTDKEKSLEILDEVGRKDNELGKTMRHWTEDIRAGKLFPDPETIASQ